MYRYCAALCLCALSTARADFVLLPGATVNLVPESYAALNPGGIGTGYTVGTSIGSGGVPICQLDTAIVYTPDGTADLGYALWNSETAFNPGPGRTITSLTIRGFGTFATRVGDASDRVGLLFSGGVAGATAARSADGDSITFTFSLAALGRTDLLFVRTDGTGFSTAGTAAIAAAGGPFAGVGAPVPIFAPVPEPASLALLAGGLAVGLGFRKFAKRRA
jgi:hypothetical protein